MQSTFTGSETGRKSEKPEISNRASIENSIREDDVRVKKQNDALIELARRSWNSIHLGDAIQSVTKVTAQTLDVARASVWLYEDNKSKINLICLFELNENRHSDGVTLLKADYPSYFAALETEEKIVAVDARKDPRTKEFSDSYLTPIGISSMLGVPIRINGQTIGVLCVEHIGLLREWHLDEENFARAITDVVSIIIENREHLITRQALSKETVLVELLKTVIVVANESKTIEEALQNCTQTICGSLNWAFGEVFFTTEQDIVGTIH